MSKSTIFGQYFLGEAYQDGRLLEHDDYTANFDRKADIEVFEHKYTGIHVWRYALDLRTAATTVVQHFTDFKGAANICNQAHQSGELFASLVDKFSHFGIGIYAAGKDPGAFGSTGAVKLSNYWPRCGDPEQGPQHEANLLKAGGGVGSSPVASANKAVCGSILNNASRQHSAEDDRIFDIWQRTAPDLVGMGIAFGCNRWGERQWEGRDVQVISTDSKRPGAPVEAILQIQAKRYELRKRTLGVEHPDTLTAVGNWAP